MHTLVYSFLGNAFGLEPPAASQSIIRSLPVQSERKGIGKDGSCTSTVQKASQQPYTFAERIENISH